MTSPAAPADNGLIVVPINVAAFCVGTGDERQATGSFAGATVDFSKQKGKKGDAYLGANVVRSLLDPTRYPLKKGIHLHWALPDELTKARVESTGTAFKPVPNRWLVTRLMIEGAGVKARSWVIESDALVEKEPGADDPAITVPVAATKEGEGYGYRCLGECRELKDYTPEASTAGRPFKSATGHELTAVANGLVSFGSFYPECRNVFGFHDKCEELKTPTELSYVVTGWFDHAGNDPVAAVNAASLQDGPHPWAALDDSDQWIGLDAAAPPSADRRSLYSGIAQNLRWDAAARYVDRDSLEQKIVAEAAIGNNPAEALSAYLRNKLRPEAKPDATLRGAEPDGKLLELLLNLFQLGLLNKFEQPQTEQLSELADALHEKRFAAIDAGSHYTLVAKSPSAMVAAVDDDQAESQPEMIDLPPSLGAALDALNSAQRRLDRSSQVLAELRWQVFADWYRIFQAENEVIDEAYMQATKREEECQEALKAVGSLTTERDIGLKAVEQLLGSGLTLQKVPAPRYWRPNEPSILLASDALSIDPRYGGDTSFRSDGKLACRKGDQLVSAVTVAGKTIKAADFTDATVLPPTLPHAQICAALLREACLLDARLIGTITGHDADALRRDLIVRLSDRPQNTWQVAGQPPSPVALRIWQGNPWLPLFLHWQVEFLPEQPTVAENGKLVDYPREFFTGQYRINRDADGFIAKTKDGKPPPGTSETRYEGHTILSPTAARQLQRQAEDVDTEYLKPDLQKIVAKLDKTPIMVQPLSGFDDALLMREQSLQLQIEIDEEHDYRDITNRVAAAVGACNRLGPRFNTVFNPIRAGHLKVALTAVDAFGQKRKIQITALDCAATMRVAGGTREAAAWLAPRLAQPARLTFRWIGADNVVRDDVDARVEASPVCGFLLPDHLAKGVFLYDPHGRALGSLYLAVDNKTVRWQSAPGDNDRINTEIGKALESVNANLRELAVAVAKRAEFFTAFLAAVNVAQGQIDPANSIGEGSLSSLVGRPMALVRASLRLEVEGLPALNQSWKVIEGGTYQQISNGFTGVQFPVMLGEHKRYGDGLIGYFKRGRDGFDLSTFFTTGASAEGKSGVVQPPPNNLLLSVTPPTFAVPPPEVDGQVVLMLVDPRARIHATAGILPTDALELPPRLVEQALAGLEFSFLAAPVLKGASGLALPTAQLGGTTVSWIGQERIDGKPRWTPAQAIDAPTDQAVWSYTPQQLAEGWLRHTAALLEFTLVDKDGLPRLKPREPNNDMVLQLTNKKPGPVTFRPGDWRPEGKPGNGSIFYIHPGALVAPEKVADMRFAAAGWEFMKQSDERYGTYWAAKPTDEVTLDSGRDLRITVSGVFPAKATAQGSMLFDYYKVTGLPDGVGTAPLTIHS